MTGRRRVMVELFQQASVVAAGHSKEWNEHGLTQMGMVELVEGCSAIGPAWDAS
jgi:hypothetical protein